jgi:hypothetical protein
MCFGIFTNERNGPRQAMPVAGGWQSASNRYARRACVVGLMRMEKFVMPSVMVIGEPDKGNSESDDGARYQHKQTQTERRVQIL